MKRSGIDKYRPYSPFDESEQERTETHLTNHASWKDRVDNRVMILEGVLNCAYKYYIGEWRLDDKSFDKLLAQWSYRDIDNPDDCPPYAAQGLDSIEEYGRVRIIIERIPNEEESSDE